MLFAALLLVLTLVGLRYLGIHRRKRAMKAHLAQFTPLPGLHTFQESFSKFFPGSQPQVDHAVLLLHGFSASPQEFDSLRPKLEARGVPYYAPALTGFGLDDFRLLKQIDYSDWLRDAEEAYRVLSRMSRAVSIVGHSSGANLALGIASRHSVRKLILIGPNYAPVGSDHLVRRVLLTPILSQLVQWLVPVFQKPVREGREFPTDTLDRKAAARSFHYYSMPTQALVTLWKNQGCASFADLKTERLFIVYGEDDLTVDNAAVLDHLTRTGIPFSSKKFAAAGHNILEDFGREEAATYIADLLVH